LFLLTGLQARTLAAGPGGDGWTRFVLAGVLVSLVVIVVRFVWVFPATYLPHWLFAGVRRREPRPPWRDPFVVGFTGIRGAVSLIAALSIPTAIAGAAFPDRDLILFVTFCVIIVTLVGEGGLLPLVFRRTGLVAAGEAEAARAKAREVAARIEGVEAVLAELSRLESEEGPADAIANLRRPQEDRLAVYLGTADPTVNPSPAIAISAVQGRLIEAERRRIAEIYDRGDMTDEARRRVERELDLEDARNRHAFESATGDSLADPATEAQQA
jgi:CPA1 family monovalent cation:H+ antiporter